LGLLTHEQSKYPKEPFIVLFQKLFEEAEKVNLSVSESIYNLNPYAAKDVRIVDLLLVQVFQPLIARSWTAYLKGVRSSKIQRNNLRIALDSLIYSTKLCSFKFRAEQKKRYSRILNINNGHMQLLKGFIESSACVGVILEDDASFETSKEFLSGLIDLVDFARAIPSSRYFLDLSESFTFTQLGADHLIEKGADVSSTKLNLGSTILRTTRAFTNTNCAVLYSREMAKILVRGIENYAAKSGKRVIPIDWIFNMVLLEVAGTEDAIECFHLDPGLFNQQSLRA
jgi:hypothetical protein